MDGTRVHLVGIGGDGMAPLAELFLHAGAEVSGSDLRPGEAADALRRAGATVHRGHRAEHVEGARTVVVSSAIPAGNPEVRAARRRGIPVVPRLRALGELLARRRLVAVCGTHGKTTTTAWIAHLLRPVGAGFYVGAAIRGLPRSSWGHGPWFVAEVDESDGRFVGLSPEIVVLTNLDRDHLAAYRGYAGLVRAFRGFTARARRVVVCGDDPPAAALAAGHPDAITYGLGPGADLRARGIRPVRGGTAFEVTFRGRRVGEAMIPAIGPHNVRNALAALGAAHAVGIPLREALGALADVPLPRRRLELVHEDGYVLVDDYAHHPREILAGLRAIRGHWPGRRVLALFQPHRYSRTRDLHRELGRALAGADLAVVTEIYPAFEPPIPGVSGRAVAEAAGGRARFVPDPREAAEALGAAASPGDVLVCFGAGDIWEHFRGLITRL